MIEVAMHSDSKRVDVTLIDTAMHELVRSNRALATNLASGCMQEIQICYVRDVPLLRYTYIEMNSPFPQ